LDLVGSGIVVLNQDGDYPAGDIIAVYDHAHPAAGCEGVLAVEALASCAWIVLAVVGACDRGEDRVDVIE
jgi:hypothetical protein